VLDHNDEGGVIYLNKNEPDAALALVQQGRVELDPTIEIGKTIEDGISHLIALVEAAEESSIVH